MTVRDLALIPWAAGPAGSAAVIEAAVTDNVAHVSSCAVETEGHGWAVVRVRVRWYAWLTFGILHALTWARARRIAAIVRPVHVMIRTRVL